MKTRIPSEIFCETLHTVPLGPDKGWEYTHRVTSCGKNIARKIVRMLDGHSFNDGHATVSIRKTISGEVITNVDARTLSILLQEMNKEIC